MNFASAEAIVKAVLYEGYILYPYRPTNVKNRQRWTFGGVFPEEFAELDRNSASSMQTECLVKGGPETTIKVQVRFLHLILREIGQLSAPVAALPEDEPGFTKVASLELGGQIFHPWEEAAERQIASPQLAIAALTRAETLIPLSFPGERTLEPLRGPDGLVEALFVRTSQSLKGEIAIAAKEVAPSTFKLTVRVRNTTPWNARVFEHRAAAQHLAFASTHTILGVDCGAFISLFDPPEDVKDAAAGCVNEGTWPVLAGEAGSASTMLSSPIILYDYPQVAPESPGDLFDGTEIDEILTLRILGMTDEEKREMAAADVRSRALLERTEALSPFQMERLHGALREPSSAPENRPHGLKPELAFVHTGGRDFTVGDRVRLRPKGGGDVMDIVINGEVAIIEAIERDFEGRVHVAVVLEKNPGRELGFSRMPGHRFFFSPEEIEPAGQEGRS